MTADNVSRSALLPERLKRKNVRRNEQNENIDLSQHKAQPWRPGGVPAAAVSGVLQQRRSIQELAPLTSSFSVRDSLQSLRSSRVFKHAADDHSSKPAAPKPQHGTALDQPSSSMGPKPRDRPVLQPISTTSVLSSISRASSCGSNAASRAPVSCRTSYSSLDSAVNQCVSPTEDGQHSIAGRGDTTHAAQSQHTPPPALLQQQEGAEPAAPQQFDRACTLAESCCELLQLLQMDVSPTCSAAESDRVAQLPAAPTVAPARHAAGRVPPAAGRAAASSGRARVGTGTGPTAPPNKKPAPNAPAETAAASKPAAARARPRVAAPTAPPLKAKQLQQRPALMQQQQQPTVGCVPQRYVHQAPPLGLTRRQPEHTARQQQQQPAAVLRSQKVQQRPAAAAPSKVQPHQGMQYKESQQVQQAISLRHLAPVQQQQQQLQDHHSAAGAQVGEAPAQYSTQQQLQQPLPQVDAVLLPQLSTALPPQQQQQAQHSMTEQVKQHAEATNCLQHQEELPAAAAAAAQASLPGPLQQLRKAQQAADLQADLQDEPEPCSRPQHSRPVLQANPPAQQPNQRHAGEAAPAAGQQEVCLQEVQLQDTAVLRQDAQRIPAAAAAAAGDPAVLGPALLQDKLRAMQQQLLEMQQRIQQQQVQLQQQAQAQQVQPSAAAPQADPLQQQQQQQSEQVPGAAAGQPSGERHTGFLQGLDPQQQQGQQEQQLQQLRHESIPTQREGSAAMVASGAEVAEQQIALPGPVQQQSQEQQQQAFCPLVLQENEVCTRQQVCKPQEVASTALSAGSQQQQQQQAAPTRIFGAAIQPQQPLQQQPTPTQLFGATLQPQQPLQQPSHQPPTQLFGAALQPQQLQPPQQYNSYRKLLEGTAALVANSHAVNLHLQARGFGGASSPLRSSYSPNRVQQGFGRTPRVGLCAGSSPAVLKQLQPSRLSVSQSWAGVSPGPTPRQSCTAAGAAVGAAAGSAGPLQQSWQSDQAAVTAAAAGGVGARARLFGPALGAVAEALRGSQSPAQPAAAASPAEGHSEAGAGTPSMQWGPGPDCMLQGGQVPPLAASNPAPFSSIAPSGPHAPFPAHSAGVGIQQQQQQQWWSLPGSPAGSPSGRQLLCSSRVAQVLYGSSPNVSKSMPAGQLQQQGGESADGVGACSSSDNSRCGSANPATDQVPAETAAARARRYADVADSTASGQLLCDSDTESEGECEDSQGGKEGVQQGGVQGKAQGQLGEGARCRQQQQQQQATPPPGSYEQQQEAGECWTVHTNWAAADLDPETAAVAAAAAAAAGLSAQLGRGQPVRLQEHNSPFLPAGTSGGQHGLDVAACSSTPLWVSTAAARQQSQDQQEQQQQQQQVPPVCSPMCLMVPKKLWGSPEGH